MEDPIDANRRMWDERVDIHADSEFYDVQGFKDGRLTLDPIEIEEIGDVSEKTILHLMCHFGLDTLSWARLGATVTGVDFSSKAVELAKQLSEETDLKGDFMCSNVYELPEKLEGEYDIVFMSGGTYMWLNDIPKLAKIVARYVKPGGFYYLRDFHPYSYIFDDEESKVLKVRYPYFESSNPITYTASSTYTEQDVELERRTVYEWVHSVSEIINSLIRAGLQIEFFNEFPFTTYKALEFLVEEENRWWLPEKRTSVPFMFSLKASKLE